MSEYQEYRARESVRALKLTESDYVFTKNGKEFAREGDYLMEIPDDGVFLVSGEWFDEKYEPIPEAVSEARKFTPTGKTIPEVLEFLKENPDEIERVKQLERDGGSRKGILEYEVS